LNESLFLTFFFIFFSEPSAQGNCNSTPPPKKKKYIFIEYANTILRRIKFQIKKNKNKLFSEEVIVEGESWCFEEVNNNIYLAGWIRK